MELRLTEAGGFSVVEASVATHLADWLPHGRRFLILVHVGEDACEPYYTAACVDPEFGVRFELVRDGGCGPQRQIDDQQLDLLKALGLGLPVRVGSEGPVVLDPPVDQARLAALLVRPLDVIYGSGASIPVTVTLHDNGMCRPLDQR